MQVRCISAFGRYVPGDLEEVPDGCEVSDLYWEPVKATATPPAAAPATAAAPPVVITPDGPHPADTTKAGM
jgi:hypothetical protein